MPSKYRTREEWLHAAMIELRPLFKSKKVPKRVRVSCGFPSKNAFGAKRRRIGEAWADSASHGKYFEIFISPVLSHKDPVLLLDTLLHEMVHTAVGLEHGHKQPFRKVALEVGLVPPMASAGAGPALAAELKLLYKKLGPYPHDELSKMTNGKKPDKCRMYKVICPEEDCGYTVRVTKKWIDVGFPTCVCGTEMVLGD